MKIKLLLILSVTILLTGCRQAAPNNGQLVPQVPEQGNKNIVTNEYSCSTDSDCIFVATSPTGSNPELQDIAKLCVNRYGTLSNNTILSSKEGVCRCGKNVCTPKQD